MIKKNRLDPVRPTESILPKQIEKDPKSKEESRRGHKLHHKKEPDSANDEESTIT